MDFALSPADIATLWLTLKLATTVTLILLLIGTPLAWWLARTTCIFRSAVSALVALPIVLPPTVIGFYLLLAMGPQGWLGQAMQALHLDLLPFTFAGLVVASVIYSLPFVVQPLHNVFAAIPESFLETAASLRASAGDTFFSVVLPLAKPGVMTAAVLGFAHTVGEFGVVLMIGGNIPNQTRVVAVQIYDHVEAMEYASAHGLSLLMLVFAFVALLLLYHFNSTGRRK